MKISGCMKQNVISASPGTSIQVAAQIMVQNHIGTLPVVDPSAHLIGLVGIRSLITLAMPDFVQLMENVDFVHDFGAVEDQKPTPEILQQPISQVMSPPVSVEASAGLLRAAALLQEHNLSDLPVVDDADRLVGIASYVDIGTALMSNWGAPPL